VSKKVGFELSIQSYWPLFGCFDGKKEGPEKGVADQT